MTQEEAMKKAISIVESVWTEDGLEHETLEKAIAAALVEAVTEAEAVERCAQFIESSTGGFVTNLARDVRSLSPDPNFLDRERLKARLQEALLAHYDYFSVPHSSINPVSHCAECRRIADLARQIEEKGVKP